MSINHDFRPLYVKVSEIISKRIEKGEWGPGEALPAEPKFADELGVSQGTIRKALDAIAREKLVVRKQGQGTYVTEKTSDSKLFKFFRIVDGTGKQLIPQSRIIKIRKSKATVRHQRLLELTKGTNVWKIYRVRLLKKRPAINESVILPYPLFPELDRLDIALPNTLYDLYQKKFGIFIHTVIETISTVEADANDSRNIKIERGTSLIEIKRIAKVKSGKPVELRVSRIKTKGLAYKTIIS